MSLIGISIKSTIFMSLSSITNTFSCMVYRQYCKQSGGKLIVVRHGQSKFNVKKLFTGWYDSPLTDLGREKSETVGKELKNLGIKFDEAHTSLLLRAQETAEIILREMGQCDIPLYKTWRLNERHYGCLTGVNKEEAKRIYGAEQMKLWHRSYDNPPPCIQPDHKYYKIIHFDPRYKNDPHKDEFPVGESLKLLMERLLPYYRCKVLPKLNDGKTILIAAHNHTLRGLMKHLDQISDSDIVKLKLANCTPFTYDFCTKVNPSMNIFGVPEVTNDTQQLFMDIFNRNS